jgi:SAM-dependent methyltransferase
MCSLQSLTFTFQMAGANIFGCALLDQFNNDAAEVLWLHNSYGDREEMPVDVFFREEHEMSDLEQEALGRCSGKVLDIGAGVGSHALVLQSAGLAVEALEISAEACSIMRIRGVNTVHTGDFFQFEGGKYDTLLMLMNGIGLAGTLNQLSVLLQRCKTFLNPGGRVIFDSSDINYLYEDTARPKDRYFGEISYQYEYKGVMGNWFHWLYIDPGRMRTMAYAYGFDFELIDQDENDQYLAQLTLRK